MIHEKLYRLNNNFFYFTLICFRIILSSPSLTNIWIRPQSPNRADVILDVLNFKTDIRETVINRLLGAVINEILGRFKTSQQNLWSKKIFGSKKFLVKKLFGQKMCDRHCKNFKKKIRFLILQIKTHKIKLVKNVKKKLLWFYRWKPIMQNIEK